MNDSPEDECKIKQIWTVFSSDLKKLLHKMVLGALNLLEIMQTKCFIKAIYWVFLMLVQTPGYSCY